MSEARKPGEYDQALKTVQTAAYELIKVIERERASIRINDGESYFRSDVIGGCLGEITKQHERLQAAK